jgi:hypothetical protein
MLFLCVHFLLLSINTPCPLWWWSSLNLYWLRYCPTRKILFRNPLWNLICLVIFFFYHAIEWWVGTGTSPSRSTSAHQCSRVNTNSFLSLQTPSCPAKLFTHIPWLYLYPQSFLQFLKCVLSSPLSYFIQAVSSPWKTLSNGDQYPPIWPQLRNQFSTLFFPHLLDKISQCLFPILLHKLEW